MKHGLSLAMLALAMGALAVTHRGAYWLLLYPALSVALVACAYLRLGPIVFGKSARGVLSPVAHFVLLPYLLFAWTVWHVLRIVSREPAYDRVTDRLLIDRRLLSHELTPDVDHVIDLTCEFNEPRPLREGSYRSFPILDGAHVSADELRQWATEVAALSGTAYVHCAQGHGRTGMFAAAVLLASGEAATVDDALQLITTARPGVRLTAGQLRVVQAMASLK